MPAPSSFCPHCGNSINPGTVFCGRCGQHIDALPSPALPASQSHMPAVYPPVPPVKHSRRTLLIVISVLGCLLLVTLGVIVALLTRQLKDSTGMVYPPTLTAQVSPTLEATSISASSSGSFDMDFNYDIGTPSSQQLPEQTDGPMGKGSIWPAHAMITFDPYATSKSYYKAEIHIFPVDEYMRMLPEVDNQVLLLKRMLAERPSSYSDNEPFPFVPLWNANMVFHTNVSYIHFNGGSGIRYLTMFSQGMTDLTNDGLIYTFQGLSDDGKYYISAVMPVNSSYLFYDSDLSQENSAQIHQNFSEYLSKTIDSLDGLSGDDCTPNLNSLDQMMSSIIVK